MIVSKSLQVVLFAVVVLAVVAWLKSVPLELGDDSLAQPRLSVRADASRDRQASLDAAQEWARPVHDMWKPEGEPLAQGAEAPAAASAVRQIVPAPIDAAIVASPAVPDPALVYLGRIEQDQRHYVFLARGPTSHVVEVGGAIDADWRVERATATHIELRHLPSSHLHGIAIP